MAAAERSWKLARIVSGGQTGVDRAALDAALERDLPIGGWCPLGRRAEDGRIPEHYPLRECPSADYEQRTEWNVRDSDGTLVLASGPPVGGTALTLRLAGSLGRPCLMLDLGGNPRPREARRWLRAHGIRLLNVAGPRESEAPGVYRRARNFLEALLGPPEEPDDP
jgi:hypothetical protein